MTDPDGAATSPLVVGIVNATPDSFYDGGRYADPIAHGHALVEAGADWLDIGGESTRPGARPVDADEEIARVLPIIHALAGTVPISIDTTKPAVARRALAAGATIVNDVHGLRDPEMVELTSDARATIVMHTRGTPETMHSLTDYDDVVADVRDALVASARRARSEEVFIDPGIGFAKTTAQSLFLLRHLNALTQTGFPVMVGASRKSFIGHTLGLSDPAERLAGSLAASAWAACAGAAALRVHDVEETRQVIDLLTAIQRAC